MMNVLYVLSKGIFWLSCFLIAYTYLLYPLVLLILRTKKAKSNRGNGDVLPLVSLVVSAYNEERVIRDKLENSLLLDYPGDKLEIIIASDGSSDATDSIVTEYVGRGVRHIRYEIRSGKINILNRTIPKAEGDIVVLSDANTMYEADAIRKMVRNFGDIKVGCVCGKLVLRKPDGSDGGELEGVYWRYETFLKELEGERGTLLGANGGIYAFRKELFRPLPGNTIVDDFVIPMNILAKGYKVVFEKEAVGYEETSKTLAEEQVRKTRIGAGAYQALLLTYPMLNILKGFPSLAFWSHKVLRWSVPFLLLTLLSVNMFLLNEKLYLMLYLFQASFYCGALAGHFMDKRIVKYKIFHLSYYFVSMNWCLLVGFFRFAWGTQKVTWQKTER